MTDKIDQKLEQSEGIYQNLGSQKDSTEPLSILWGFAIQWTARHSEALLTSPEASPFRNVGYVGKDQQPRLLQVGKALKWA